MVKNIFYAFIFFILCLSAPSFALEQRFGTGVGYSWSSFSDYGRLYTPVFALQTEVDYRLIIATHLHLGIDLEYYYSHNDQSGRAFYDILQFPYVAWFVGFGIRQANILEECISIGSGLGVWVGSSYSNDNTIGTSDAIPASTIFIKAEANLLLPCNIVVGSYAKIERISQLGTQSVAVGCSLRIRIVGKG